MQHTLISFLGKARKEEGGHYRSANYQFSDTLKTTDFFGLGLCEVIQPDAMVILGTSGSMWDVFYEKFATSDDPADDWLQLAESVEQDSVNQGLLDAFSKRLSEKFNLPCRLKLIPYGVNAAEQTAILQTMADEIKPGDQVSLDMTHGLRHLPMLGLLSAMYLQTAKQVTIRDIYYGALELTRYEITPVMQLNGLLTIADWITALHGFDKTGDIAPFADLLKQEGLNQDTADLLKTASFYENNLDISKARRPLREFKTQTQTGLPGIAALFNDSLQHRIEWINGNNIYLRQREKALFYLQQGDYLRASALGFEALISWQLKKTRPHADAENYTIRQEAKEQLESDLKQAGEKKYDDFKTLRGLRNSMAHSNRSDKKQIQRCLNDETLLKQTLQELFDHLLPTTLD